MASAQIALCTKKSKPESGFLPLGMEVMEYFLTQWFTNWGKQMDNIKISSKDLILQWVFCNVYPVNLIGVEMKIKKMEDQFQSLKNAIWLKYSDFLKTQKTLFDIRCDSEQKKIQEKLWGVDMSKRDFEFYENQCLTPKKDSCTSCVDRK